MTSSRWDEGVGLLEFVIAFPVVILVIWGGLALGIHSLDGMVLKYSVYEEARRVAVSDTGSSIALPVVRVINGWASGLRGLPITGSAKRQGKNVKVDATKYQPWRVNPALRMLSGVWSWFGAQLGVVEQATGQTAVAYSLPKEGAGMYPAYPLKQILTLLGLGYVEKVIERDWDLFQQE